MRRVPNILFITCWYPIKGKPNFAVFVREHARAVKAAGGEVVVGHIIPQYSPKLWSPVLEQYTDEDGFKVCSLVIYSRLHKFLYHFWPLLNWQFYRLYRTHIAPSFKPNILHGNVVYPAGFITRFMARKLGVPYHLSEHWTKLDWIFDKSVLRKLAQKVFEDASGIHPVSGYLAKNIRLHTGLSSNIQIVPNVVDTELFHRDEEATTRNKDRVEILCVMNFYPKNNRQKLPELLAEALSLLPLEQQRRFRIRYIGPGQEESPIFKKIMNLELEAELLFDGYQSKSYIAEKMRNADYLMHPTNRETFGVVVAEALQSGLPCIISDDPALEEQVDSSNGWIVPDNTPEQWKVAFKKILNGELTFDRRKIAEMGKGRFAAESVGQQFMDAYRCTLNGDITGLNPGY